MPDNPTRTGPPRTLTITGRGTASADPDLTVLSFGVVGRDPSYSASVEELNGRVEALREDLEGAGVERTRLKTTSFGVRDDRRYDQDTGEHVFLGYEASHRLRLEIPFDRELLNAVLARVASSASEATVTISFDVSDTESLRRRAMRAAVADAQEGARVLADASGATLGEILRIDYSYVEIRTRRFSYEYASASAMYEASAPAPDVEPEALDAEEGVTVVWEIS
jgi:uncharacterized protein YggE